MRTKIRDVFLFKGLPEKEIDAYLDNIDFKIKNYNRAEIVYSPDSGIKQVGFVLDGTCVVKRIHPDGSSIPLNTISPPGSFGIISILAPNRQFPTYIVAKTKTEIAFISEHDLITLIRSSADIAINVAEFLAERVSFLNDKVSTFTATNCEKKLASTIIRMSKENSSLEFLFNRKRTAELISCGRASLYRSLDSFKNNGLIDFDNKKIYIKELEGLERIVK